MAERVGRERIVREAGYLYYLGKDGYIWKIPTKLNPSGRKARIGNERIARLDGYMYFLGQDGYLWRSRMQPPVQRPPGRGLQPGGGAHSARPVVLSTPHGWSRRSSSPPVQQGTVDRHPIVPAATRGPGEPRAQVAQDPPPGIPAFPRAEKIGRSPVRRERGYIYHFGSDGFLWKTPTLGNRGGRAERVGAESLMPEDGYVYFLDHSGFVARAPSTHPRARGGAAAAGALRQPIAPEPQPRFPAAVGFCPRCGTRRGEDHTFCAICGLDFRALSLERY